MSNYSLRKQTKSKFDALLKSALEKKSKSQQNLVSDSESIEDASSYSNEIVQVDVYDELNVENKLYIMEKFLNQTGEEEEKDDTKPPVPLPRKKIGNNEKESDSSGATYVKEDAVVAFQVSPNKSISSEKQDLSKDSGNLLPSRSIPVPVKRKKVPSIITDSSIESNVKEKDYFELKELNEASSSNDSDDLEQKNLQKKDIEETLDNISVQEERDRSELQTLQLNNAEATEEIELEEIGKEVRKEERLEVIDQQNIIYENEIKKSKSKKSKKKKEETSPISYDYGKIVAISVHFTDRLLLDSYVVHPVVKIHIMDITTGKYLKKSDKSRNVLFFNESAEIDYIGPIMTESYNLQEHRTMFPNWEETIHINEDANYLLSNSSIIIFFEIVDFLSISIINQANDKDSLGWHKIAWAFFKPTLSHHTNTEKQLRLQLYYPNRPKRNQQVDSCSVFNWWKKRRFKKYPSTLYVTLKSVTSPIKIIETMRSKHPNEIERGRTVVTEQNNKSSESNLGMDFKMNLVNQGCKLPNNCAMKIDGFDEGSLIIKFSNNGKHLACAVTIDKQHVIIIQSLFVGEDSSRLVGHQGLIYSLVWSKDDKYLISASADCTVFIWNMSTFKFIEMLPHPAFVYTCDISCNTIVTGCYDQFIRIWRFNPQDPSNELIEEIKGHRGYVTSVCFNNAGNLIFSADSVGEIIIWKYIEDEWKEKRKIHILDIRNTIINQILLHKREKRVLINSRDNKIRLIDIKTGFVLQTYHDAINNKVQLNCCFSPCGNYIFSGSEKGELYIWNTESGKIQHFFNPYSINIPVNCVHFNPQDNYLALSHYGLSLPILIYNYVRDKENEIQPHRTFEEGVNQVETKIKTENVLDFRRILEKIDAIITTG